MMLTRWEPFKELNVLQDRINRAFNEMSRETEGSQNRTWAPVVDILENDSQLIVRAELPGMDREDINVEVTSESLTISGERKFVESENDKYLRVERPTGQFQRSFTIGVPVQAENAKASYRNGILEVVIPKAEEVKPKKINITAEE